MEHTAAVPDDAPRIVVSTEAAVYAAIFVIALLLRVVELGAVPLSPLEATQAAAARGIEAGTITSPLAYAGARIIFALGGVGAAGARVLPMLVGLLLTASPLLFRHRLGRVPTLITVELLAIVPTAVMAARQMGGFTLAMLGLVVMLWAIDRYVETGASGSVALAGGALAFALLADYAVLVALVAMGIGVGVALLTDEEGQRDRYTLRAVLSGVPWASAAGAFAAVLILGGTVFFFAPQGFAAFADQFGRFTGGILRRAPGAPLMGLVLGGYEFGIILFGVVGAWVATQSPRPWLRFLGGWGIAAILLAFLYQGWLPGHALWVTVPMAALSGVAVTALLELEFDGPAWGIGLLTVGTAAMIAILLLTLGGHLTSPDIIGFPPDAPPEMMTVRFSFQLALGVLMTLLLIVLWLAVSIGFGTEFTLLGMWMGFAVVVLTLAAGRSVKVALTDPTTPYEILTVAPVQPGLGVMHDTLEEVGRFVTRDYLDTHITVQAQLDGVLEWSLSEFSAVTYIDRVDPSVETPIVITPADAVDPALGAEYVGQDFVITRQWSPAGLPVGEQMRWLLYHQSQTPTLDTRYILWVREDVYRLESP
ncbi:MAG: hypothetical protein ACFB51_20205 [Anaerolineae bacterium]